MIDEIDKMGADFRGDPASAMLEVLDPSQNDSFRDHYLDLDFDLSEVIFIATANMLDPIPPPLRDRMEVIQLSGYTVDEKLHIARRYLVPRQMSENGLKRRRSSFSDAGAEGDHRGVHPRGRRPQPRAPDRHRLPQARPRRSPRGAAKAKQAHDRLGQARPRAARPPPRLLRGPPADQGPGRRDRPRLDPGRRRGPVHRGDRDAGLGRLTITGQLGDVMKESAQAALSLLRGDAGEFPPELPERLVRRPTTSTSTCRPAPSPRTAPRRESRWRPRSTSLSQRPAGAQRRRDDRRDHADRPGAPVGGLKEKSLAAQRAGIKRVIAPDRNEGEILEIPEHERARARVRLRRARSRRRWRSRSSAAAEPR